ncbi:MAG: ABC transporter substrate-binding protein [Flavobacteriales bacterium]
MKKLLVLLFCIVSIVSCRKDHDDHDDHDDYEDFQEIKVAALLSQTGGWSNLGITSKAALEIAVDEINHDFECRDIPFRFELTVFETQLDPLIAAQTVENISSSGYKFIIGPQSSAELALVKPIADSLGILVVSQGSTASSLAIANDMIFRFVPGDQIEGAALANSIKNAGKQALVTLARNDAGNLGLQGSVGNNFTNLGGNVISVGNYETTTTDFTTVLADVKSQIIGFNSTYTNDQIAVYLASFDEAVTLFNQASSDPVLSGVNWYGGDGFVKNSALLQDPAAAQFAIATNFFCPDFGLPLSTEYLWSSIIATIDGMTGIQSDAYTLAAYDALYVISKLVENEDGVPSNATSLQAAFLNASNGFSGATGVISLNENGDRSSGSFNYWGLENLNGTYQWVFVGQSE